MFKITLGPCSLCGVLAITCIARPAFADDAAFTPAAIQVPDGFVVEVAAAAPLVKHPMMAAFDDRGRLFIAESAGEIVGRSFHFSGILAVVAAGLTADRSPETYLGAARLGAHTNARIVRGSAMTSGATVPTGVSSPTTAADWSA